jgi:DNA-binding NarL/FixJ family response regulator
MAACVEGPFRDDPATPHDADMPDPVPVAAAPLRILVVDGDDRVRESLAGLLCIGERVTVVGSAGTADDALDIASRVHPDVIVIDPRLPDLDRGLDLIAQLRRTEPDTCILAMSWSDTLERAALDGGADGFVRKTFRSTELVSAIVAMSRGTAA